MRTISIVLLTFASSLTPAQQPAAGDLVALNKLSIPAQLSKTVRADKAHPGDPVELRTLEAVLVSNGLVIPANTVLRGRVLSARPKQEGKNSWVAFVVERAEWKQHSLPLRAFVAAQITMKSASNQSPSSGNAATPAASPPPMRQSVRMRVPDPNHSYITRAQQDAMTTNQDELGANHHYTLEDVGMLRAKDGTTYLVSSKTTVKLPAGLMLVLKNEPAASPETSGVKFSSQK